MKKILPLTATVFLGSCLVSCASNDQINNQVRNVSLPQQWQAYSQSPIVNLGQNKAKPSKPLAVEQAEQQAVADFLAKHTWLQALASPELQQKLQQALTQNQQLKAQAYALVAAKQSVLATGSSLWPALDLDVKSRRNKAEQTGKLSSNHELSLGLSYELDIWGKLSANEQQAQFIYLAEQASFEQRQQQLMVNVVNAWYSVVEANSLLALYHKQVANTRQNLAIIEAGYQAGLNSALDVYLTRNELNNDLGQIASQEANKVKLVTNLERLLGQYPAGKLVVQGQLPELVELGNLGIPSELLSRKPELKASWYQLLAKNASLAYAHKQRFPSLRLSASVSNSGADIGDVFSADALGWSLLGSLSQPLFYGGRLAANEERARAQLKQTEQGYLDTLYGAFLQVENALANEASLAKRYQTTLAAQKNAELAATLSFEKYQSGLVTYTTVLDAQQRFYNAQRSLIAINHQLIENRINLHLYLGGDLSSQLSTAQVISHEQ